MFSPGAYTLTTKENLADIEDINKVFGGDVDTGQMNPSAVVELEGKSPLDRAMAGGDKPLCFRNGRQDWANREERRSSTTWTGPLVTSPAACGCCRPTSWRR